MHRYDASTDELARLVVDYALKRIRLDPPPLDGPRPLDDLHRRAGQTITEDGLGGAEALRIFQDVLAPATISVDHPRFVAFVPAAPTGASVLFDLVVGASSIYGGSWAEGAGAVYAENQALRWIADLAGFPSDAGGCFVPGGTAGNLSALIAARHTAEVERERPAGRWRMLTSKRAHSSVDSAARVMDIDIVGVPTGPEGRMLEPAVRGVLEAMSPDERAAVFAIVATSGTTNLGIIDDLAGIAQVCEEYGIWFHVDGAYGAAALVAPSVRDRFDGIERADSLIVDPHKWLYAPYDSCALLYRDPELARAAHTQHAGYLAPLTEGDDWNPSDYAHHLSRRARGLPFWFSLATYGTAAYRDAIETTLRLAKDAARLIEAHPDCELLVEPELSVVAFRRIGWSKPSYDRWSDQVLRRGLAWCVPTSFDGQPALRMCFVNPLTTTADVELILGSLVD